MFTTFDVERPNSDEIHPTSQGGVATADYNFGVLPYLRAHGVT